MDIGDIANSIKLCGALYFGWNASKRFRRRVRRSWLILSNDGECFIETGLVLRSGRNGDRLFLLQLRLTAPRRLADSLRRLPRERHLALHSFADRPGLKLHVFELDLSCRGLGRLRLAFFSSRSHRRSRRSRP